VKSSELTSENLIPRMLGRLMRLFLRTPVRIYKALPGYERLFGQRWILVTTKGRRSGRPHSVMLDLVGHDEVRNCYYVLPGWGRRSDWVKNIEAHPRVDAQVGRVRFSARVRDASGSEGADWMTRFMKAHPIMSIFAGMLMGMPREMLAESEFRQRLEAQLIFALEPVGREG
jgi:deazaflavin-dependent oxidoreductase (nitroreductase family)